MSGQVAVEVSDGWDAAYLARVALDGSRASFDWARRYDGGGRSSGTHPCEIEELVAGCSVWRVPLIRWDQSRNPGGAIWCAVRGPMCVHGDTVQPDPAPWGPMSYAPRDVVLGLALYVAQAPVANWTPPRGLQARLAEVKGISGAPLDHSERTALRAVELSLRGDGHGAAREVARLMMGAPLPAPATEADAAAELYVLSGECFECGAVMDAETCHACGFEPLAGAL